MIQSFPFGQIPWEKYESPYPPNCVLNSTTIVLLERGIWQLITNKSGYAIKESYQSLYDPSRKSKG